MTILQSINPHNAETLAQYETFNDEVIEQKIKKAHEIFLNWRNTSFAERRKLFHTLADEIEKNSEELAILQTLEMGMIYTASLAGLKNTVHLTRWFADNAESILWDEEFERDGEAGKFKYDPIWVIFGIAPWNFPFNQVLRAAIPNIIAGNTTVYKHASNVPQCAARIEKLFVDAGFPQGVYTNMFIDASKSELVLSNPYIAGTNLTGSEGAGSAVGSLAGKYLKPSVLELWGNDAFIVASNSRIEEIATEAMKARIANNGEKCNSSKRFIVPELYYDEFVKYAKIAMEQFKLWDPMNEDTHIWPLARPDLRDEVHTQVEKTLSQGARLVTWGKICEWAWYYYEATILADVTSGMTSYHEEVFGPVATIIKVADMEDAIQVAND
jgi:succinate-semialdehyde dehydrogenase/glutarate-semialdehyde dehydrogenase